MQAHVRRMFSAILLVLGAIGCGGGGSDPAATILDAGATGDTPATTDLGAAVDVEPQRDTPLVPDPGTPKDGTTSPTIDAAPDVPTPDVGSETPSDTTGGPAGGFVPVDDEAWDETSVRKVLNVFAYGGFATDAQIAAWAEMDPRQAVGEIITFDGVNPKLSAPGAAGDRATLRDLADFWASDDADNPMPEAAREDFGLARWTAPMKTWLTAATRSGLNPVRQRIGLLETSYHLAVNQNAGVNNWQMLRYYDDIMNALADGLPYEGVLAVAASSAAAATQYNHRENRFIDAKFEGNEDFGREIHQLYFGVLGEDDPEYHELVTIRNSSKALTDMNVATVTEGDDDRLDEVVTFGTEHHYPGTLEVYGVEVGGATARERIDAIVDLAVDHPESLDRLPVILIRFLADDVVDADEAEVIREAWARMESKDLLAFLRDYAASTTFHSPSRVKSWSTVERSLMQSNLITLTPEEAATSTYDPWGQLVREGVTIFRPLRNVFGGQTGLDAAASGAVFREAYNTSVERVWFFARPSAEDDGGNTLWTKDWAAVIPPADDGTWRVKAVAEWLWQRFIGDGLKDFGTLERAHVYTLVGGGKDLALFTDKNNPTAVYGTEELETRADLVEMIGDMEIAHVALGSEEPNKRLEANRRVGYTIAFITATPYAFAQEGD